MRRQDREVKDKSKINEIISRCHCCRLGLNDNGSVYIVPLNFGEIIEGENIVFYFHGAKEGRKIDIMNKNPNVGFELDTNYTLHKSDTACSHSAAFQSIIGSGVVSFVEDKAEKIKGLNAIMKHTTGKDDWEYTDKMLEAVCVFKLAVTELSCKEHK